MHKRPLHTLLCAMTTAIGLGACLTASATEAPTQAAERRGVYAVGYASDMAYFGPKTVLTSIKESALHYIQATQSVIDQVLKSQDYWGDLKEDITDIKSGAPQPFTGPIKDQAWNEKRRDEPSGQVLPIVSTGTCRMPVICT